MGKLFWVGPRESDICGLETLFSGSITLYGSDTGGIAPTVGPAAPGSTTMLTTPLPPLSS